jgi:hypothetical protein
MVKSGRCLKELKIRRSDLVLSTKVFWGHGESPNAMGLSRKQSVQVEVVTASLSESINIALLKLSMHLLNDLAPPMWMSTSPTDQILQYRWKRLAFQCQICNPSQYLTLHRLFGPSTGASNRARHTTGALPNGPHSKLKRLTISVPNLTSLHRLRSRLSIAYSDVPVRKANTNPYTNATGRSSPYSPLSTVDFSLENTTMGYPKVLDMLSIRKWTGYRHA